MTEIEQIKRMEAVGNLLHQWKDEPLHELIEAIGRVAANDSPEVGTHARPVEPDSAETCSGESSADPPIDGPFEVAGDWGQRICRGHFGQNTDGKIWCPSQEPCSIDFRPLRVTAPTPQGEYMHEGKRWRFKRWVAFRKPDLTLDWWCSFANKSIAPRQLLALKKVWQGRRLIAEMEEVEEQPRIGVWVDTLGQIKFAVDGSEIAGAYDDDATMRRATRDELTTLLAKGGE